MKSQKILVRNLPSDGSRKRKSISVKPVALLYTMLVVGFILLFFGKNTSVVGAVLLLLSCFCLPVLPDRTLIEFSNDYLVLHNQHDRQECMIIYYEDIVSWQYEWHSNYDVLSICLVDGSTESQEMFSKWRVQKYLNEYAPDKELKKTGVTR